ncbi:MAG TPA: hypothetical protein P5277_00970 [Candidatus Paceibacterota bacterium]|nr:hypothetical protein [Candidatus Paceibacterota bacterium]
MRIFDFFKKVFNSNKNYNKIEENSESIVNKREFTISDLKQEIKNERSKVKDRNNNLKLILLNYLEILIKELENNKKELQNVDLTEKNEDEKLKLVVKENLSFYINNTERFIDELKNIDTTLDIKFIIIRIQNLVDIFEKNSKKQYEKATILIGNELVKTKDSIKEFFKKINELITENNDLFDKEKKLDFLEKNIKELDSFSTTLEILKENFKEINSKNEELIEEKETLENNFNSFKSSKEFEEYKREREMLKSEINNFNKDILRLKDKVNLRFLIKYFHKDPKKSMLLRDYQENFIKALDSDENQEIVKIVNDVLYIDISEDFTKFVKLNRAIKEKNKEHKIEKQIKLFEEGIRNIDVQLNSNKNQIESERLKIEKFEKREEEIVNNLLNSAKTIFGQIVIV